MSQVSMLMKMRAAVSRGSVTSPDSYGLVNARIKDLKPIADRVPCYIWIEQDTDYVDGKSVAVERMCGYFRKDADVQRLDVITEVLNRRGDVVYPGPIAVDAIAPKVVGGVISHLVAVLRRNSGT